MKYFLEIEIAQPVDVVGALIGNPDHLKSWQPDLLEIQHLDGEPGAKGSTALLKYQMGKSTLEMKETILENDLPNRFVCTYEAGKVWNKVENDFEATPAGGTKWLFTSEFKCGGFMRLMVFFMPGMFKKQSLKSMHQFKDFAEGRETA
ncbi:SRPBCC family protein [Puniceicoccales bacterium CK1056]|uniref:SRPBCC family protein n=1 Tax=Oceanipulchritudo coccoides TaxID=2706888 RepID=A0A6B2M0C9_9BACT|nr:SRPBCC family protein [Oceanipulchritudo coccoides]NDV62411.1 SRPBCC family protein [Oceanipulchritudo coccoides]